jgi:hypothetical protein
MKSLEGVNRIVQPQWRPGMIVHQQLGGELKTVFDGLTAAPLPDKLMQLADALEEAFQRGDLFEARPGRRA